MTLKLFLVSYMFAEFVACTVYVMKLFIQETMSESSPDVFHQALGHPYTWHRHYLYPLHTNPHLEGHLLANSEGVIYAKYGSISQWLLNSLGPCNFLVLYDTRLRFVLNFSIIFVILVLVQLSMSRSGGQVKSLLD